MILEISKRSIDLLSKDAAFSQYHTYFAKTDDGWKLALHRFRPSQMLHKTPVILCHDMAQNSILWNLKGDTSLARYLRDQGFEVWSVDLRGAGQSTKPGWLSRDQFSRDGAAGGSRFGKEYWTLDDSIHLDVPAILQFVRQETQSDKVSWIGNGMGASIMAGFLVTHEASMIKNFIAIGMPMTFHKPLLDDVLVDYAKQKEIKQFPEPVLDELFFYRPNMDWSVLNEIHRDATEDVSAGVLEQFQLMIRSGEFLSSDKRTNYARSMDKITVPTLLVAGRLDNIASLVNAYEIYARISSTDKTLKVFQISNGCSKEYGHDDLVAGKNAPAEIYPPLAAWLKDRS